jgi:hypothetical protein
LSGAALLVPSLATCLLAALVGTGCSGADAPRVRVVNRSALRLEELWVRTRLDSVRVPTLAPGESAEVRPRVRGEDRLRVTGRYDGRPIVSGTGEYVEGTGGYRFRAVVDSSGRVEVKFIRMGLW